MKKSSITPISSDTQLLLNHVYQGCQMGMDSVHRLVQRTQDDQTRDLLLDLAHEHRRIMSLAAEGLRPYRTAPEDLSAFDRMRTRLVSMQAHGPKTKRRISQTLILGSRMALRSLMRDLRKYPLAQNSSQQLVGELIELEKRTLREGIRMAKKVS